MSKLGAMKSALFIFILFVQASSAFASCFHEHVIEGRQVNLQRKADYAHWAQKHDLKRQSKLVSNALIGLETLMLPSARIYDLKARKYSASGLFCDDFVPISETPSYQAIYAQIPSVPYIKKIAFLDSFEKNIKEKIEVYDWAWVRRESLLAIAHFPARETHCLTRHFVESIGRISALAPGHINQARAQGLKDPRKIIASMIRFHLFGLDYALKIDALAAPLQYQGIPIVCQDIPHIPIPALTH